MNVRMSIMPAPNVSTFAVGGVGWRGAPAQRYVMGCSASACCLCCSIVPVSNFWHICICMRPFRSFQPTAEHRRFLVSPNGYRCRLHLSSELLIALVALLELVYDV